MKYYVIELYDSDVILYDTFIQNFDDIINGQGLNPSSKLKYLFIIEFENKFYEFFTKKEINNDYINDFYHNVSENEFIKKLELYWKDKANIEWIIEQKNINQIIKNNINNYSLTSNNSESSIQNMEIKNYLKTYNPTDKKIYI